MKVGLYFGSFNPVHIGHLIIVNHLQQHTDLDEVWMVVSPHNPLKKKNSLLDDYTRLNLVKLALDDYPNIKFSDIEFGLKQPNYTTDTLAHLSEKFPKYEFALIMGSDNIESLHKWKNHEHLLNNHSIYVCPRPNYKENPYPNHSNIIWVKDCPFMQISATFIRKNIALEKSVKPMLPSKVWEYIDHNNLYKNN